MNATSIIPEATEGFRINSNHSCWDSLYLEIRRLCIIKGAKIKKYAPTWGSKNTIRYSKGRVIVNQLFWSSLKPAHKSQLTQVINKIAEAHKELARLQKEA